jgi:two-component system OmpR family response regulator
LVASKHTITRAGEEINLSPTEFRLILFLAERAGRVVSKEALLDAIWGINFDTSTTVIDTYISYLRRKLHTPEFQGIKTVRAIGFKLEA